MGQELGFEGLLSNHESWGSRHKSLKECDNLLLSICSHYSNNTIKGKTSQYLTVKQLKCHPHYYFIVLWVYWVSVLKHTLKRKPTARLTQKQLGLRKWAYTEDCFNFLFWSIGHENQYTACDKTSMPNMVKYKELMVKKFSRFAQDFWSMFRIWQGFILTW